MNTVKPTFTSFLFDLDGTLVDSIPDLTTSINLLRHELELPAITTEQVRSYVGDGVGLLVQRALPAELFSQAKRDRFVEIYTEHLTDETFIYPGIISFLEAHRNTPMAVVTNKTQHLAAELIQRLGLASYFQHIIGMAKGIQRKPHPDMINLALQKLGEQSGPTLMFGDHHVDLRAASAAGISNCFCAWGLGHDDGLLSDFRAESTDDLLTLFPGRHS